MDNENGTGLIERSLGYWPTNDARFVNTDSPQPGAIVKIRINTIPFILWMFTVHRTMYGHFGTVSPKWKHTKYVKKLSLSEPTSFRGSPICAQQSLYELPLHLFHACSIPAATPFYPAHKNLRSANLTKGSHWICCKVQWGAPHCAPWLDQKLPVQPGSVGWLIIHNGR